MRYEGTADAVYQNLDIIESYGPEFIAVLAGDHSYKMDYELMQHVSQGADVTVWCIEVLRAEASGFRGHGRGRERPHHLVPGEAEGLSRHAGDGAG
jgi:ADP-glucose pyrophosphorylase